MHHLSVVLLLASLSGVTSQRTNTKTVDAVCLRKTASNSVEMHFTALFGSNTVDKVLAVNGDIYTVDANGNSNEAACAYSGDIATDGRIHIVSVVYSNGQASNNPCGVRRLSSNPDRWSWTIQLREKFTYKAMTELDRSYVITCETSSTSSDQLTAFVNVFDQDTLGNGVRIKPRNEMLVLTQQGSTSNYSPPVNNRVDIQKRVKLVVQTLSNNNRQVNFDPYASYVFSCDFRYALNGPRQSFIGGNGCPTLPNPWSLTQGFRYFQFSPIENNQRWFQTETQPFVMVPEAPPNNFIIVSCYVGYCFGTEVEPKCKNYCGYSARRKRSITDEDLVTFVINIGNDTDSGAERQNSDDGLSSSMVIVVISVACILAVVGAFVALSVCLYARRRREEKMEESVSGSQVNLPAHLSRDHFGPMKA